mgnify:CR=1 FL=1
MIDLLHYTFFQNALLGACLASIVCGIIGTYIVARRLVFISGGVTHASFGGIGLGVFLGINPILSATLFAILSAFGVEYMAQKEHVREDSAIALFWTFGMSVGIICCFLTPGFIPDLPSFLFGSILTIDTSDLLFLAVLAVVVILFVALCYRAVLSVAFDRTFALSQGLPVRAIEYVMMALIAMTIVSTLRMVGIVMVISLLSIPQLTAAVFTRTFRGMILWSMVVGFADCLGGLSLSYLLNVPSGAAIIVVSVVLYFVVRAIKALFQRFSS